MYKADWMMNGSPAGEQLLYRPAPWHTAHTVRIMLIILCQAVTISPALPATRPGKAIKLPAQSMQLKLRPEPYWLKAASFSDRNMPQKITIPVAVMGIVAPALPGPAFRIAV